MFDMFASSCRKVEKLIVSKFAGSLNTVLWRTYVKSGMCGISG